VGDNHQPECAPFRPTAAQFAFIRLLAKSPFTCRTAKSRVSRRGGQRPFNDAFIHADSNFPVLCVHFAESHQSGLEGGPHALRSIIDLSTLFQAPDQCACSGRMRIRRRLRCMTEVRGGGSAARVRLCLPAASIARVHASTVRWRFYPRAQVIPPSQLRDPGICPSHERGAHDTHFAQHGGAASHPLLSHIPRRASRVALQ
jgi:hypothetical protein